LPFFDRSGPWRSSWMAYFRLYFVVAQKSSSMRPFAFLPAFPYRGRSASNSSKHNG